MASAISLMAFTVLSIVVPPSLASLPDSLVMRLASWVRWEISVMLTVISSTPAAMRLVASLAWLADEAR